MTGHGRAAVAAWRAPGRVNLIGDHTDYNEGLVLPFAIDRGTRVSATPRAGDVVRVSSAQRPGRAVEARVDVVPGARTHTWADYVLGCVWALRSSGVEVAGAQLLVDGDLALGAGLSSSASLTCATTLALLDLAGVSCSSIEVAQLARQAEVEFVGAPVGLMDQIVSMSATPGHATFLDVRDLTVEQVRFDPAAAGRRLMIIDSRVRHRVPEGAYAARVAACHEAATALGVGSLRDVVDVVEVDALTDPVLRARARHVVSENERVSRTVELLVAQRLDELGPVLLASHASLRDDFEVSTPELDVAVEAAVSAGADGARLTGAGFGGSVITLVPQDRWSAVASAVAAAYAARDWQVPDVWPAQAAGGARRVSAQHFGDDLSNPLSPDRRMGEGSPAYPSPGGLP